VTIVQLQKISILSPQRGLEFPGTGGGGGVCKMKTFYIPLKRNVSSLIKSFQNGGGEGGLGKVPSEGDI